MHLRQVTACPQLAAFTTFRRRSGGGRRWQIFICRRHRRFPGWSVPGNLRGAEGDEALLPCGTVHDYRPHTEIIALHLDGWLGGGSGSDGSAPGDWQACLRAVHAFLSYVQDLDRLVIAEQALRLAEAGAMHDLLAVLAEAEATAERERSARSLIRWS
jgi:hypothetical protein